MMYWGCCAQYPYTAPGLGADGDGLALFAASERVKWKPQALAFQLWHNITQQHPRRRVTHVTHNETELYALAADGREGLMVLIANPTNRSVTYDIAVPSAATPCSLSHAW